jgi:hypothetical protein
VRVILVHFSFQVSPEIKITLRLGDLGGQNTLLIFLFLNIAYIMAMDLSVIFTVALSCRKYPYCLHQLSVGLRRDSLYFSCTDLNSQFGEKMLDP